MKFRQATYEEFKDLMRKAILHEYEHYRTHVPTERREWMRDNQPDFLWNIEGRESVVTEDGKNIVVTFPNGKGSRYLYSVYVDAEQRNHGIGTALINYAKEGAKEGVALHVASSDDAAQRLYKRLGFKPYGMGPCRSIFMATRKGLPGKDEWGND